MAAILDYLRELNMVSVILRLVLAAFFGGMIGLERGRKGRAAGFRTYMLVCMGSALAGVLSQYFHVMLTTVWAGDPALSGRLTDVTRIGAMVIGGVGFLGAGTIMVNSARQEVKGLTTAAGLWASACLGIAVGAGFYECAVPAFAMMFVCIRFLPRVEDAVKSRARSMDVLIEFRSIAQVGSVIEAIKASGCIVFGIEPDGQQPAAGRHIGAVVSIGLAEQAHHERIIAGIAAFDGVLSVEEL